MDYKQKLLSPLWQKKRLKILERDNFSCRICHSKENTLNVHHIKYNGQPWDADDNELITLCEKCHENEHLFRDKKIKQILDHFDSLQYSWRDLDRLKGMLIYVQKNEIEYLKFALAFPPTHKTIIELGIEAIERLDDHE